jgi:putative toxin-antitoxin system antitoxin component (TIGR02293 family)
MATAAAASATTAPQADDAWSDVRVANDTAADAQIRDGYPVSLATDLQETLGLSDAQIADVLGRSRRTFARYRDEGQRLGLPESERLFRYLRLLRQSQSVFGSSEKAAWWMTHDNPALDGRAPVEVALTAPGAAVVEELLGGIEHGAPL